MKNFSFASPVNITYMWNMGSMLGLMFMNQIITGLLVSMHYFNYSDLSFMSYMFMNRNINMGFMIKFFHANGASLMFLLMYIHIFRGFLNKSPSNYFLWMSGITILLLTMMIAFVGYVLPWGNMSFWAATVITNLISTIPHWGNYLTMWIWGSFSVSTPTLNRFFSFHFLLPFVLLSTIFLHILILHIKGSNNPLGLNSNIDKIPFKEFFSSKDMITIMVMILILSMISLITPNIFIDSSNFLPANFLKTPSHIQPEWYFLFAYAILRSIPNKLGGVVALIFSILILVTKMNFKYVSKFNIETKLKNFSVMMVFMILTFLGSKSNNLNFILMKIFSFIYFLLFII